MRFIESIYSKQWVLFGSILTPLLFLLTLCALRDSASTTSSAVRDSFALPGLSTGLPLEVGRVLASYAASKITPQQTYEEIMLTVRVLAEKGPCNFLVFGLGYDSALWKALNHGGRTVFLEETKDWVRQMTAKNPDLEAYLVKYTTKLSDATSLLKYARKRRGKECRPVQEIRNSTCKIALSYLPRKLYDVNWDVIMVDAPRGYFPEAPGRMAAIFSASVIAKTKKSGSTDIYVHDVDRSVERQYCDEFLCDRNLVEEAPTKRLRHYRLYPKSPEEHGFC